MNERYNKIKKFILRFFFIIVMPDLGCSKLIEVHPPATEITSSVVYNSDETAIAVLIGVYARLSSESYNPLPGFSSLSYWAGLSADEFNFYTGLGVPSVNYYTNTLNAQTAGSEYWSEIYSFIFTCNTAIIGLKGSHGLTPAVKTQLLGEAEFLRAYFYFYLVNLYGDVPLVLSNDYTVTAYLPRVPKSQVYQQIISDLNDAQTLLNAGYIQSDGITVYPSLSAERVRPNKSTATALLARTYLYTQKWDSAETQATTIINNSNLYSLDSLNGVFLKNSNEAIWQLKPVSSGSITNTQEAPFFVLSVEPAGFNSSHPVSLSTNLLNSFEPGDLRMVNGNWVNLYTDPTGSYYYPYKYKITTIGTGIVPSEYTTIFRLGEQYLIRAEARTEQNNIPGAQADLNMIRTRAGLPNTLASSQQSLLAAILHERQVELFSEMGHRWLDLKRTDAVDSIMSIVTPQKGGNAWNTSQQLYPISSADILKNPSLTQNPGY